MSNLPDRVGIYEDKELTKPIKQLSLNKKQLYLGKMDAGDTIRSKFYIRNESIGDIEEMSLAVIPSEDMGLQLKLLTKNFISKLEVSEVYMGEVEWSSDKNMRAGPYHATIILRGKLTRE